jgi:orotidine-5'-phosphate decarboxylase
MIPNHERLIVAIDVDNIQKAKDLVNLLGDSVSFYKIGLELAMSGDYFELIEWLATQNKKIFADLKLYDISATVGKAVRNLSQYKNINFLTIHTASKSIMQAAAQNKAHMNILAVTVLTNLDQEDLLDMGFDSKIALEDLVLKKSKLAKESGINGVVASGFEADKIRELNGEDFLIVTPGIRLESLEEDDQKRVMNVKDAFKNGADYIVVGRPITTAQSPKKIANQIQEEINCIFPA